MPGVTRIVVTGASGLLGSMVVNRALQGGRAGVQGPKESGSTESPGLEILALTRSRSLHLPPGSPAHARPVELSQTTSWQPILEDFRPHTLIHCAALTHVDRCEEDPHEAHRQNALVPQALARWCAREGVRLVHISTDGVFSGPVPPGGFPESHPPRPVNVYGASKAEGEERVLEAFPEALVVRTNLFGWGLDGPAALAGWILQTLRGMSPVPGWTDVWFNPLFTGTLAVELLKLATHPLSEPGPTGLLHLAACDSISKYDFARAVAVEWGHSPERVKATRSTDAPLKAHRPLNTTLSVKRWMALTGGQAPSVEGEVAAMHRFGMEEARLLEALGAPADLDQSREPTHQPKDPS